MSKKSWIIFVVVVMGLLVALVVWSKNSSISTDVSGLDTSIVQSASDQNGNIADHVFGKSDSKVVFIEYGDFQCPACGSTHPKIKAIAEEYKDHIAYVFRNFPLTTIHQNARAAAGAVEAAGLQGKYWEMHDLIYNTQSGWSNLSGTERTDAFVADASSLGLDTTKFTNDLSSSAITQKISFDQAIAKSLNVDSTPTFYLNGKKVDSSTLQDLQNGSGNLLRDALDASLKAAGVTPPKR